MKYLDTETRSILLATDFTPQAQRAFDAAIRMARTLRTDLHILHVNEERSLFRSSRSDTMNEFLSDIAQRRGEWLGKLADAAKELGVEAKAVLRDGTASKTILAAAAELDVGLIVMGTAGAQGVRAVFAGSTARRVLRKAERPCLVVSSQAGVAPARAGGTFEELLYPTDLSPGSQDGLKVAHLLVERTQGCLSLVHVLRIPAVVPALPGEPPIPVPRSASEELQETLGEQMLSLAANLDVGEVITHIEVGNDAAHSIAEVTKREGIDLIVMPRHSRHGVGAVLFGRTAENLIRIAPAPVLLFSPPPG